ncbi:hypothetical protein [Pontibacter sp. G13]|uniref:hypothetical protein n=1 Tax=Pontibacter sp. G13 TaxID=3074898 RepID=UPI0028899771|nr:hypothetical protein [Pontibacter sp. G13]WNJ15977.1 hypothetical protein RJD25_14030 [Pontibacter sp. G13]
MTKQVPPLYGRFQFSSIGSYLQRLGLVSEAFMGTAPFNSYVTTFDGNRQYGLTADELQELFVHSQGQIHTMRASCSGPENRSVNINVKFAKGEEAGEGQFVIVARSPFENRQISDMLNGVWHPQEPDQTEKYERIGEIITFVRSRRAHLDEEERKRVAKVRLAPPAPPKPKPSPHIYRHQTVRDRFTFQDQIPIGTILSMMDQISYQYLGGAPFNIRIITNQGDPISDLSPNGLRKFFDKRRAQVLKILMDAATAKGELVDLVLLYGMMATRENAELQVNHPRAKEIQNLVRTTLEQRIAKVGISDEVSTELFQFERSNFSIERVIKLMEAISSKYLERQRPLVFLTTFDGDIYPSLTLDQVERLYTRLHKHTSNLLFGVNHPATRQTFSLLFQFETKNQSPYGSVSMRWGSEKTHRMIQGIIREQLQLKPLNEPIEIANTLPYDGKPSQMVISPVFEGRDFDFQQRTALIAMPLEAYWSDTIWMQISQSLKNIGWDTMRAEALFGKQVLEPTWNWLNEVDLLVADLTYKHPDVFYKLGMAHTLGKKVIMISQHARDFPPDFKKFPHIVYDNNIHGLQRLANRLVEIVKSQSS